MTNPPFPFPRIVFAAAALLASSLAFGQVEPTEVIETDAWRFRVLLDDKPIGHHDFVVRRTRQGEHVEIDARFDVRFLRIPVYSYRHVNSETWRGGCLQRLESETDDNGESLSVSARSERGRILVTSGDESRAIERECVRSFAYWNRDIVDSDALLNAQTGKLVPVNIEPVTASPPAGIAETAALDAYRIDSDDGEIRIEVAYYRDSGRWVYLQSRLENGRVLRYLPLDVTAAFASPARAARS